MNEPERISLRTWANFDSVVRLFEWRHVLGARCQALLANTLARYTLLFLPTVACGIYYFGIASDQYESEARFVVRSAARSETPTGLAFLVQLGLAKSQDDSFVVQDYITSRDAIERLSSRIPLKKMYGSPDADFLARYPSILYRSRAEEFYRYFQRMVSVVHSDKTGIAILRVRAFNAADAHGVAEELLQTGEDLVNRINTRLLSDAVGNSLENLANAQRRLIAAHAALTEFRNQELIVDPARNAVALAELIGHLSAELATTRSQITEMRQGSASSPQLLGLQRKSAALENQIAEERGQIAGDAGGLAGRIATFERLSLEREFASRLLSAAESEATRSRSEAARQLMYLERIVEPSFPDYSLYPRRAQTFLMVFAFNGLLGLIGWLVYSGVREHAAKAH